MLSICIPIYNYDMTKLVRMLHRQADELGAAFEILLIDDCSDSMFQKKNRGLAELEWVRYEELDQNIGRSRIRNLLMGKANYDYLLFLDCDSELPDTDYLKRYLHCIHNDPGVSVIVGGTTYANAPGNPEKRLHWLFGSKREVKTAAQRLQNPHKSFTSNNFLIHKNILKTVPFNEMLSGYGHEDTLLGYEINKRGIPIRHIDNPLIHKGLETAKEFLAKTDQGLKNLLKINELLQHEPEFIQTVRVLNLSHRLKRLKLLKPFVTVFSYTEKSIVRQLLGKSPNLWMLDYYKLGKISQYSIDAQSGSQAT